GGTADRNRSHWSTSKTPSYTKSVSWQHHHVNLHDFFATARLQSKYNSFAALSAAATALFQIIGL
ncbi:hypothetical protein SNA10_14155, partial [Escherichia coli]|nr:hypothetical protein [Escherichia coli]